MPNMRHEEKVTFYCSTDELEAVETLRAALRRTYRIKVDRGAIIRAALELAMRDYRANEMQSAIFKYLNAAATKTDPERGIPDPALLETA